MCGIVAYLGASQAKDILVSGLQRLEYRGYDSAGIAVIQQTAPPPAAEPVHSTKRQRSINACGGHRIKVVKSAGKVSNLVKACEAPDVAGSLGIAHTRGHRGAPAQRAALSAALGWHPSE